MEICVCRVCVRRRCTEYVLSYFCQHVKPVFLVIFLYIRIMHLVLWKYLKCIQNMDITYVDYLYVTYVEDALNMFLIILFIVG